MLIILGILLLGISIIILQDAYYRKSIDTKIKSIGGNIVKINRKFISTGPFGLIANGRCVYMIAYQYDNCLKEGWVKFGGFFGTDWRL